MSEERAWFDRPVPIALGCPGSVTLVNNALQAADLLLNRWPATTGSRHVAARKAVLKALQNHRDAKLRAQARQALADAAEEAGILR